MRNRGNKRRTGEGTLSSTHLQRVLQPIDDLQSQPIPHRFLSPISQLFLLLSEHRHLQVFLVSEQATILGHLSLRPPRALHPFPRSPTHLRSLPLCRYPRLSERLASAVRLTRSLPSSRLDRNQFSKEVEALRFLLRPPPLLHPLLSRIKSAAALYVDLYQERSQQSQHLEDHLKFANR